MYDMMQKRSDSLIIKKRSVNYNYIGLQTLYNRLPNEHIMKSMIYSKMLSVKAGIIGETIVENIFKKYQFPFNYRVLHDVNLTSNGKFQMDTIFISSSCLFILESKNIVGELSFETDPPYLVRTLENGQKDMFESPEVQLERNIYLMKEWLKLHEINLPVKGVIIISSTKSRVVRTPNNTNVIYASSIPVFLRNMQPEKEYLSVTQMDYLAQKIVHEHQPYLAYPMCKNWGIIPTDLVTGVQCGNCSKFGMLRVKRTWVCPECSNRDANGHTYSIIDWFVLIGGQLSNSECRRFLHIHQHQTVTRILHGMELIVVGSGKLTKYEMSQKMQYGIKDFYLDRKTSIRL